MQRRKFIAGLGSLTAAGAAGISTGAFTSVQADRNVAVEVADDSDAFLQLEPADGPNGEYATTSGGTLAIDLSGSNPTDAGGTGVNTRAITVIERMFAIENQGTQAVDVTLAPDFLMSNAAGDSMFAYIYPEDESEEILGSDSDGVEADGIDPVTLGVGDREHYDVYVSTTTTDAPPIDGSITIEAEASST
ncbi:DUF1102 domain-containing protein [Halolamina sediminis]|uniref:DUF1102 domain-containing protein n=1 Tax=Halolamina sediminis TaxID=1480675 RepID=UPI0006B53D89|nr:DUF1102 domain-containing protein [Halolamina sediminis]